MTSRSKSLSRAWLVIVAMWLSLSAGCQESDTALDDDIAAALANRVDAAEITVGVTAGLFTAQDGATILTYGLADREAGRIVDSETMFRIGPVGFVFTTLLLAEMVNQGDVELDDPISQYLPESVASPRFNGQEITLLHLATHTSGLPRIPLFDEFRPPAQLNTADFYNALSGYELTRMPGSDYEESLFGAVLLADMLARHSGISHEELLRSRIFGALGMGDTTLRPSDAQKMRIAAPYNPELALMSPGGLGALETVHGWYSTAADMLAFVEAFVAPEDHELSAAMQLMQTIEAPISEHELATEARLGFLGVDDDVYYFAAGVPGYTTALAMKPSSRRGAVVLANTIVEMESLRSIALHATVPERRLLMHGPPETLSEVSVAADVLNAYIGQYVIDPEARGAPPVSVTVRMEDGRLAISQPSGDVFLIPASETDFFAEGDTEPLYQFVKDELGAVTGLRLRRAVGSRVFPLIKLEQ